MATMGADPMSFEEGMRLKRSLLDYLESTAYVKLAPSTLPGAGVGVMALRSIPSGVDPFAGPNPQCRPPEVFIPLGQAEMARMPADVCAHAMSCVKAKVGVFAKAAPAPAMAPALIPTVVLLLIRVDRVFF